MAAQPAPDMPILVVDDFHTVARVIEKTLRQAGFTNVVLVHAVDAALDELRNKPFGLVISDWKMEPVSGLGLLRRMRLNPTMTWVPFILMSANPHPELPDIVRKLGGNGVLCKPVTAEAARKSIAQALAV